MTTSHMFTVALKALWNKLTRILKQYLLMTVRLIIVKKFAENMLISITESK